jgi:hypothetical protein
MKKLSFALFLLLSFTYLSGQNEISKDQLIQIKTKLEVKKKIIEDSLLIINKEIEKIEVKEFESQIKDSIKFLTKTTQFNYISKEPNFLSKGFAKFYSGESIEVLDYVPDAKYFYVRYKNLTGYTDANNIVITDDIRKLMAKEEQDYELEKLKKYQQYTLENEQQMKQEAIKKDQQYKLRKQSLIDRYGVVNTDKILAGKIWLGMTKDMVIESWGKPEDINRTVTTYSVSEQWIYGEKYLYFDDGILTSWQD